MAARKFYFSNNLFVLSVIIMLFWGVFSYAEWVTTRVGVKPLKAVTFINDSVGWAVGYNHTVCKTVNGGKNWNLIPVQSSENLIDVVFFNKDTGIAVVEYNLAFRITTDGGMHWDWLQGEEANYNYLNSIYYNKTNHTLYCAGIRGTIIKSSNQGRSWSVLESGVIEELLDIFFIDTAVGIVVGKNNTIRKTVDGGQTWVAMNCSGEFSADFHGVSMADSSHCCIVGSLLGFIATSDGGKQWHSQYSNPGLTLNAVGFIDTMTGYAVGDAGSLLSTTDGGINWVGETGTYEKLSGIFTDSAHHVFIVGNAGIILRWTDTKTKSAGSSSPLSRGVFNSPKKYFLNNTIYIRGTASNNPAVHKERFFDLTGRCVMYPPIAAFSRKFR